MKHPPPPIRAAIASSLVLPLALGACSEHRDASAVSPDAASRAEAADRAEPGLEVRTFVSSLDERTLAAALVAYVDQPVPMPREMEDLWNAHGLRVLSVPVPDAERLARTLQTEGSTQRQWLGQAYTWTEAVHGNEMPGGRVVALDAERIRLTPGMLRLLVRDWVEPVPPEPAVGAVSAGAPSSAPGAVLRVEVVPQHRETRPPEERDNPFIVTEPKIDAESQGLLFSRLYARMGLASGRALLVVPTRPGVNWKALAAEASEREAAKPAAPARRDHAEWGTVEGGDSERTEVARPEPGKPARAGGPARVGEVVRGESRAAPAAEVEQPIEPGALDEVHVPTLGEAMLARATVRPDGKTPGPPQRTMVMFIPHVPREFHLLGGGAGAAGAVTPRAGP